LESELFGYEDGAFTGARKGGKPGFFELADAGTIFLDEIGDAPPSIQNKLLRVLQEKEIMRVSATKVIPVNVRVIAATNKDLFQLAEQGLFRLDLYYRLRVLSLHVPPLRERKEDIEILLYFLIHKHGKKIKSSILKELIEPLRAYSWPGNIRELENIAEYIATIHGASKNLKEDIMNLISPSPVNKLIQPNNDASLENLLFRNPKMKTELRCILQVLHETNAEQMLVGRYRLQTILQNKNFTLSPQQIKTRLDMLRNAGLINTHNGKGSVLTADGEQYLNTLSYHE
jgi:sigma-54 dependent transcriptional regulator, acetoin dehydrogenase operon transcriptional activator AcoR